MPTATLILIACFDINKVRVSHGRQEIKSVKITQEAL